MNKQQSRTKLYPLQVTNLYCVANENGTGGDTSHQARDCPNKGNPVRVAPLRVLT
jgi:hypothetical protein